MKGSSRWWGKAALWRRGGAALGVMALLLFGFVNYSQGESPGVIVSADGYIVTNHHVIE